MDLKISDPVSGIVGTVVGLVERFIPDKAQQDAAKLDILRMQMNGELQSQIAQLEINKTEAASASVFVAGWRPFIGWICGVSIALEVVMFPLIAVILAVRHSTAVLPHIDMATVMALLVPMLGLTVTRTVEKLNNAQNNH